MYHVSDNPRCLESCELICCTLMELLERKHLDDVTVTTVARESGVSRVTFYKHFDSLHDVLDWKSDSLVEESFRRGRRFAEKDIYLTTWFFFTFWTQPVNSRLLEVLIQEGRFFRFQRALETGFVSVFAPVINKSTLSDNTKPYVLNIYPVVCASILLTWIQRGKIESVDKLVSISLHNNRLPDIPDNATGGVAGYDS